MDTRNAAIRQWLEGVIAVIEDASAVDIGSGRARLEDALQAQIRLREAIDSLVMVRVETDKNIEAIRRVLELMDAPSAITSTETSPTVSLAGLPVWKQAEIALRDIGDYAPAKTIEAKIRALGGDAGKTAITGIMNGAKSHPEVFVRRGERGSYLFGLVDWMKSEEERGTDSRPVS
jgi:hypothetical protein